MSETTLSRLTPHVYWMSPGKPDRPALAAVTGRDFTLMLDAGASTAHAQLFLAALAQHNIVPPRLLALSHWHWDHVFGAAELAIPVIAHRQTAEKLAVMAMYAWDNAALAARVAAGKEISMCADDIQLELPEPRTVQIVLPQIILEERLEIRVGDATITLVHVGGDHAPDACIAHILPDKVLFLGDCLYEAIYTPLRHYTSQLIALLDKISGFDADYFIEGHSPDVLSRAEFDQLAGQMRLAHAVVAAHGTDENAAFAAAEAHTGIPPDEDLVDFIRSFIAGRQLP